MPWKLRRHRYRFIYSAYKKAFKFNLFFNIESWLVEFVHCMRWCLGFRRRAQWEGNKSLDVSLEALEGTEKEEREKVCIERYAKLKDMSLHFSASSASKGR